MTTVMVISNIRPEVNSSDPAIWERIALVPWTRRFIFEEEPQPASNALVRDPMLKEKLISELSGVLAWIVEGAKMSIERRGKMPHSTAVEEASFQYREYSDAVGAFVELYCEPSVGEDLSVVEVYGAFRAWAKDVSFGRQMNMAFPEFVRRLEVMGLQRERRRNGGPPKSTIRDYRLLPDAHDSATEG
jgi:phage/plasmid-associated DNA primase